MFSLYFNNILLRYLRCTQNRIKEKSCPARAVSMTHDNMNRHSGEPHTHESRNYEEDIFKRKITGRAINYRQNTPHRKIFDDEFKKYVNSIFNKLNNKLEFSIECQN